MSISIVKTSLVLLCVASLSGFAAAQNGPTSAQRAAVTPASSAAKRIGFRSAEWKTIHAHDKTVAEGDLATLQKIGCEAKSNNHGNHIDIQFRCSEWKTMEVTTDQLVDQWSTWLSSKGMETVVVNPTPGTTQHTVQYRMPVKRSLHLHDPNESAQIISTMKMIGVTVATHSHGDHIDASFQCPEWKTIQLPSDGHAHAWQDWLKNAGFETKHSH